MKTFLENVLSVLKELPGGAAETALTIATDAITPPNDACQIRVDTEAGASTDDLKTINATNVRDGHIVILRITDNARTVRIVNGGGGAGQIFTADGENYTLTNTREFVAFKYKATNWEELFRNNQFALTELLGAIPESTLTIATGAITPKYAIHAVDTEGAASTDDLDAINQTNLDDGRLLLIHPANAARDIVVRHNIAGTGKILLRDGANLTLSETYHYLLLKRVGTTWEEVTRFGTVAKIADGGTNNGALGVAATGIYAGDGTKITQVTAAASQSWRVNAAGTAVEAYTPAAGGGGFGGDGVRQAPTTGTLTGEYWHNGDWSTTGAITAERVRLRIKGNATIGHTITVSTELPGAPSNVSAGGFHPGVHGHGLGAGDALRSNATYAGGGGGGCGGAGGDGGSNSSTIVGGRGGRTYAIEHYLGGSSGASGATNLSDTGGGGGSGGGGFYLEVDGNLTVSAAINANGGAGSNASGANIGSGGGGGGSGGVIDVRVSGTITVTTPVTWTANGGNGGNGTNLGGSDGGGGGGGGGGIIHVRASTITETGTLTLQANGGAAGSGGAKAATAGSAGVTSKSATQYSVRSPN